MDTSLHKVFINEISQVLPILGESGSEFSYFIPELRNVSEVNRVADNINKPWLKSTLKQIKNLINNTDFQVQEPEKGDPITPCMGVYKAKIQYDGSLDKLKLRIVVRGDLQNKELVGYTWSPTASMRTLEYLLMDAVKHKAIVHQLDFIGAFLQKKLRMGILRSWTVDIKITFHNIEITLEYTLDY